MSWTASSSSSLARSRRSHSSLSTSSSQYGRVMGSKVLTSDVGEVLLHICCSEVCKCTGLAETQEEVNVLLLRVSSACVQTYRRAVVVDAVLGFPQALLPTRIVRILTLHFVAFTNALVGMSLCKFVADLLACCILMLPQVDRVM